MTEYVQEESPFARFRRLKQDPRFIQAVTTFCEQEQESRYLVALEYARWWAPNVREFNFEMLIILERDIAIEMLIERGGRQQLEAEEDEDMYELELWWEHKQLFAFWPRWIEHAHGVLGARIWTQQAMERHQIDYRMANVERKEIAERKVLYEKILDDVQVQQLEWGDFVPKHIQEEREAERRRLEAIREAQERDVELLRELYQEQREETMKQRWVELFEGEEAERLRIQWQNDQTFEKYKLECFPEML